MPHKDSFTLMMKKYVPSHAILQVHLYGGTPSAYDSIWKQMDFVYQPTGSQHSNFLLGGGRGVGQFSIENCILYCKFVFNNLLSFNVRVFFTMLFSANGDKLENNPAQGLSSNAPPL